MRPQEIFEVCLDQVREYQALEDRVTAIRQDACAKGGEPLVGNLLAEYVADFYLVGRRVLQPWPKKLRLFEVYYLNNVPYTKALKKLQVRPGVFDGWCAHIKQSVGKELAKVGLFPPRKYRERSERND